MNMKMIVSAFRAENTADENARNTARLLLIVSKFAENRNITIEMAVGCYNGNREISLVLTGWRSVIQLEQYARTLRASFGQECVYTSIGGLAKLIYSDAWLDKRIGFEFIAHKDKESDIFNNLPENYTELLDGKILYTMQVLD